MRVAAVWLPTTMKGWHPPLREAEGVNSLDRENLVELAATHDLCPHAFARACSEHADVVLGDYQRAFDLDSPQRAANALLVDEAHQLVPRVRDLLSPVLDLTALCHALNQQSWMRRSPSQLRRWRAVELAVRNAGPAALDEALLSELETLAAMLLEQSAALPPLAPSEPLAQQLWQLARWRELFVGDELAFRPLRIASTEADRERARVQLLCLDPGPHIAAVLNAQTLAVRFSGTLSPMPLYQLQHGLPESEGVRIASPHSPEHLKVLIVDDLPQYYRCREASLPSIIELLVALTAARPGACLVGAPSFAFLSQLAEMLTLALREAGRRTKVLVQPPQSTEVERSELLQSFHDAQTDAVLLVALGGVFSESLDYTGIELTGTVVLGVGLSPPSAERKSIERYECSRGMPGATLAYQQPAMERVVQLVGRIQRGPEDRGYACLVDDRFLRAPYQQFFPSHWRPERCGHAEAATLLAQSSGQT